MTEDIVHTGQAIRILDAYVEKATDVPGEVLQAICLVCERLEHYEREEKERRLALRAVLLERSTRFVAQENPFLIPKSEFLRKSMENHMKEMVDRGIMGESEVLHKRAGMKPVSEIQGKGFDMIIIDDLAVADD